LVTNSSLKLINAKLYSPYKFTVMHCTLNSPHTILKVGVKRYSLTSLVKVEANGPPDPVLPRSMNEV